MGSGLCLLPASCRSSCLPAEILGGMHDCGRASSGSHEGVCGVFIVGFEFVVEFVDSDDSTDCSEFGPDGESDLLWEPREWCECVHSVFAESWSLFGGLDGHRVVIYCGNILRSSMTRWETRRGTLSGSTTDLERRMLPPATRPRLFHFQTITVRQTVQQLSDLAFCVSKQFLPVVQFLLR